MAVMVAVAVNTDGRREVLGITVMPSEAETFWSDFLRSLTRRGLRGVQMVISDAHQGLKAAAHKVLGAGWQRCRVHFQRNLLARVSKPNKPVVSAVVKTVFAETDPDQAHARWREVADSLRERFRDIAELMERAFVRHWSEELPAMAPPVQARWRRRAPSTTCWPAWPSTRACVRSCTAPTRWSARARRSSGAPMSSGSSRTARP